MFTQENYKPFLWNYLENTTNINFVNFIYDEIYEMNVLLDSEVKMPLVVSNKFARKTFTKTMIKKETDDEDE